MPFLIFSQVEIKLNDNSHSNALEISSEVSGLLIPSMTNDEKNIITSQADGLLIYQNNNDSGFKFFDGCQWVSLGVDNHFSDANNNISYVAAEEDGNYSVEISLSSNIYKNLSWSRSGNLITFVHDNHGLSVGDGVYLRSSNVDNLYVNVLAVTTNSFNVETTNSGNQCGKLGAYQKVFTANVTNEAGANDNPNGNIDYLVLNKPDNSPDVILKSIKLYANDQTENFNANIYDEGTLRSQRDLYFLSVREYPSLNKVGGISFKITDISEIMISSLGWGEQVFKILSH